MGDFHWGLIVGFVAGVLVSAGVYRFTRRRARPAAPPAPSEDEIVGATILDSLLGTQPDTVAALRQDLRLKYLHDEEKISRAIEFERSRRPDGSEEELLRAAIERWERDNR